MNMQNSKEGHQGDSNKSIYAKELYLDKYNNQYVYARLTLDKRKKDNKKFNCVARVQSEGEKIFINLGYRYTENEFRQICNKNKPSKSDERKILQEHFNRVVSIIKDLDKEGTFTLKRLRDRYIGATTDSDIYKLWDEIIKSRSIGTAESYSIAKKRFIKDNGDKLTYADINQDSVIEWQKKMQKDNLSRTSVAIYMRSLRVVINEAKAKGYIKEMDYKNMFTKKTWINKSESRKDEFLNTTTMTRLYNFWETGEAKDEKGNEIWYPDYKKKIFYSLGLFLFMYLGNGMNLADVARLRYNEYYYNNGRKAMRFLRHKTKERSEDQSEVVFPILPQIEKIINRIGKEETINGLVFPIFKGRLNEINERKIIAQENSNIRDRMKVVCKYVGITQQPSPTWCRHSFATNLNIAGVPIKYISDSMGHSSSNVTSRYIDDYPLSRMIEYNSKLIVDNERIKLLSEIEEQNISIEDLRNAIKYLKGKANI